MSKPVTALIDADYIRYTAASVGEKRSIIVTHRSSGKQKEFSNRTEFYGHHSKKSGGWLGETNSTRTSPFLLDEFDIEDVQTPGPLANVLHTTKLMYKNCYEALGTKLHKGFVGSGDSFRVERSTLLKYKGNRDNIVKPIYLEEVGDYLKSKLKCEVITQVEVDDFCVMEAFKRPDRVVVGVDKDYYGQPIKFLNINKVDEGVQNGDCFGSLRLNEKKEVKGVGRMFLYWQVASNDTSDNFAANCMSDIKWGDKSAYKALVDCQTDKECFESLVGVFKKLYPEPKTVRGWRGDDVDIDWLYVLQECWDMARMLRKEGEIILVKDILTKMGIDHE